MANPKKGSPRRCVRALAAAAAVLLLVVALASAPGGRDPARRAAPAPGPRAPGPAGGAATAPAPPGPPFTAIAPGPGSVLVEPAPGERPVVAPPRTPVGPGRRVYPFREAPGPDAGGGDPAMAALRRYARRLGLDRAPGELVLVRDFTSPVGRHVRWRQHVGGLEVEDSEVSVHLAPDGRVLVVNADVWPVATPVPEAAVDADEARMAAVEEADAGDEPDLDVAGPVLVLHPRGKSARPAWRVDVDSEDVALRVWIDALTGEVAGSRDLRVAATGTARVFRPNPILSRRDGTLTDAGDQETPALAAEISEVVLEGLDGTGYLRGEWADVTLGNGIVHRPGLDFLFLRSEPGFEQASAYYYVDTTQRYLRNVLGFHDVNARPQAVSARGTTQDNSFYDTRKKRITLGTGGVDDAEDGDIVIHEYGHAIQDNQVPGFGAGRESGAIGEGFADYLACTLHDTGDPAWDVLFGAWDAVSFPNAGSPPALRRLDNGKTFPASVQGKVHADGEIWSGALWDIRKFLGAAEIDRLVIGSHYLLTPSSGFLDAASALLATNESLRGGADREAILAALTARGLIGADDVYEENDTAGTAAPVTTGGYRNLYLGDDDWFRFEVEAGTSVRVVASFDHPYPNLGLRLTDATGNTIRSSASTSDVETVETDVVPARTTFLVRAFRQSLPRGPYDLAFTGGLVVPPPDVHEPNDDADTAAPAPTTFVPGLSLPAGDEDWFRLDAVAGTRVRVASYFDADAVDLDMEIRDVGGDVLATSDGVGPGEALTFDVPAGGPGEILLRVFAASGEGSYALGISVEPLVLLAGRDRWRGVIPPLGESIVGLAIPGAGTRVRTVTVRAARAGRRGAVPEVEVLGPLGEIVVPRGAGARKNGARVEFTGAEGETFRLRIRPVPPTEGAVRVRTRVR